MAADITKNYFPKQTTIGQVLLRTLLSQNNHGPLFRYSWNVFYILSPNYTAIWPRFVSRSRDLDGIVVLSSACYVILYVRVKRTKSTLIKAVSEIKTEW